MELTLREKIALQRQIKENLNTLKAGVANLRERIALQRKIKEDWDKLRGKVILDCFNICPLEKTYHI